MDVIQWGDVFETGHCLIDDQHRTLVEKTNKFGELLAVNSFSSRDFQLLMTELVSYTQYHFLEEETAMSNAGVDLRHITQHKEEHERFLSDVTLLKEKVCGAGKNCHRQLFEFLINWLVYHILGSDMSMSRQMKMIAGGFSAAQAYADEEKPPENATDILLQSLNKLFFQVSQRNAQLAELNEVLESKVTKRTRELEDANQQLQKIAMTDVLTGLPNRRFAMDKLEELWQEASEKNYALSCLLIDADGFKQINDNFGHDAGDKVLSDLSRHLTYVVRTDDFVCRLGGDEFLILCPRTNSVGAWQLGHQVHEKVSHLIVPVNGGCWHGSISVGMATRSVNMNSVDALIKAADDAVYQAKKAGRNCVRGMLSAV